MTLRNINGALSPMNEKGRIMRFGGQDRGEYEDNGRNEFSPMPRQVMKHSQSMKRFDQPSNTHSRIFGMMHQGH
jgi:hypothetical protein